MNHNNRIIKGIIASVVVILALVGISYNRLAHTNTQITGQTAKVSTSTINCPAHGCNVYWSPVFVSTDINLGQVDVSYCSEFPYFKDFKVLNCQGENKCGSYKDPKNCGWSVDSGWNNLRDSRNACITECYKPYDSAIEKCNNYSDENINCGYPEKASSCSCINSCLQKFSQGCVK